VGCVGGNRAIVVYDCICLCRHGLEDEDVKNYVGIGWNPVLNSEPGGRNSEEEGIKGKGASMSAILEQSSPRFH